jgi:uncharacterized protein GlcG (DUF336 family)
VKLDTLALIITAFEEAKIIKSSFWLSAVNSSGFEILSIWIPGGLNDIKPQSKDNALRKAITACSRNNLTGFATVDIPKTEQDQYLAGLRENNTFSNLLGGAPLYLEKINYSAGSNSNGLTLVGGLGVSGLSPEQDLMLAIKIIKRSTFQHHEHWSDTLANLTR